MVPLYTFVVDITAPEYVTSEKMLSEILEPRLEFLRAFVVGYGRTENTEVYYPPGENSDLWSFRFVLSLSVGKNKIEKMWKIFEGLLFLLEYELPDFGVDAQLNKLEFSSEKKLKS